ncbi:MAG: glycine C-acetyltransferase [Clostridia bacterium]
MNDMFYEGLRAKLGTMKKEGKFKTYQHLLAPMSNRTDLENHGEVVVLCANNYLGFSNHPDIVEAGKKALDKYGAGAASVRFICGTYDIHRTLEEKAAAFTGHEAALTYTSCWNANTAVIPALVGDGDCVISDALNHASIIDGCRMVGKGVQKFVYRHSDMEDLERILKSASACSNKLVITDGVFSMEGDIARFPEIMGLAKKYGAVVLVDDSHATGVIGDTGRGTEEHYHMVGQADILTSTFGKALGGAGGGFVAGKKEVIDMCIQTSRPSLFSNALPPVMTAMALKALELLEENPGIVRSLKEKTEYLRKALLEEGLVPLEGQSAIVPIIVGDTALAIRMAREILEKGVYVTGFGFPVVPEGSARIRLQVSDALTCEDLDHSVKVIKEVYDRLI